MSRPETPTVLAKSPTWHSPPWDDDHPRPRADSLHDAAPPPAISFAREDASDDEDAEIVAATDTPLCLLTADHGPAGQRPPSRTRSASICAHEAPPAPSDTGSASPMDTGSHNNSMGSPRLAPPGPEPTVVAASWLAAPLFGFPPPVLPHIAEAYRQHGDAASADATKCDQQWEAALKGVALLAHAVPESLIPLRRLARKFGIAPHMRGIMWLTLSGVAVQVEENDGFCAALLEKFGAALPDAADAIEKDIERTFPGHPYFALGQPGELHLRRVLHALCWRNPLLSYCQSFNYIVGLLLLFVEDEEGVFWMATHILERLLPNDYYSGGLLGIRVDQSVLNELVKQHLPKFWAHAQRINFDAGVLVPAWVMSLFVSVVPITTVVAIWDYMLTMLPTSEPSTVPLAIVLAILKLLQPQLMLAEDAGDVLSTLTQATCCMWDDRKLIKAAHDLKLDPANLRALRRKHRNRITMEVANKLALERQVAIAADLTTRNRREREGSVVASPQHVDPAASGPRRLPGSRAKDSFMPSSGPRSMPRGRADSDAGTGDADAQSDVSDDQPGVEMAEVGSSP